MSWLILGISFLKICFCLQGPPGKWVRMASCQRFLTIERAAQNSSDWWWFSEVLFMLKDSIKTMTLLSKLFLRDIIIDRFCLYPDRILMFEILFELEFEGLCHNLNYCDMYYLLLVQLLHFWLNYYKIVLWFLPLHLLFINALLLL